ncbi:MAG: hypothetical protein M1834_007186 [Cirrosporium novae-zelandiae]|nr:MAG: hypothetical protein M1834_007186 [Cirrosporium novae-zelandiae]
MTTLQALQTRLQALGAVHTTTQHLIARLQKLPHQSCQNGTADEARIELTAEIHQQLKEQEEEFELLSLEVGGDYLSTSRPSTRARSNSVGLDEKQKERIKLAGIVAKLEEDLKIARTSFRQAQLTAKRAASASKVRERERRIAEARSAALSPTPTDPSDPHKNDLFYRRRATAGKDQARTEDEVLVGASSDVTAALRRTHDLMVSELGRSRFANETLEAQQAALSTLGTSYNSVSDLLSRSKSLISTLVTSQKSDTWYLETAIAILLGTIAWLVWRRLLYGPTTLLIIWPLKLLWKSTILLFGAASTLARSNSNNTALGSPASISSSTTTTAITTTNTRPPLIVKPSAQGHGPRFPTNYKPYVVVGGGGKGGPGRPQPPPEQHHLRPTASPRLGSMDNKNKKEGSLSEEIGKRFEETREGVELQGQEQQGQQEPQEQQGKKEHVVRAGDGTVLRERMEGEVPNPKKRMFEEPSAVGVGGKKDEL